MLRRTSVLILLILTTFLISCDESILFENNQGFERNTWVYEDAKTFSFDIKDSLQPVKLSINLRTTTNYPYSNIYMFMHSNYPNGYSDIVENRAVISKGNFPVTGKYTFKLEQAMRNDSLPEVLDVGMQVQILTEK